MPKVSVAQIMAHKSLDTIRDSFDAEMKELGYVDGENIDLDYQDAGGNTSTLESILSTFAGHCAPDGTGGGPLCRGYPGDLLRRF